MGIIFGLLAAFFWGAGDYLISMLTHRVGTGRALLYIQVLSLLTWVGLLASQVDFSPVHLNVSSVGYVIWLMAIATGIFHVVGLALTYRAFEIGTLSLVSPIASGFAIVTALLALISGEHPTGFAIFGALCLILGVTLATRTPQDPPHAEASSSSDSSAAATRSTKNSLAGVPEAVGSALAFGTMFWMFYFFVQPQLGYAWPLIILKTMASGASLISVLMARSKANVQAQSEVGSHLELQPDSVPYDPTVHSTTIPNVHSDISLTTVLVLAAGAALTDTLAWLTYIRGTSTEYATVVTALASLFSVVTILLAWVLLRERLAKYQWGGIAIILFGILLVSIG